MRRTASAWMDLERAIIRSPPRTRLLRANPTSRTSPSRSRWTSKSAIPRSCGGRREVDTFGQCRTRQHLSGGIVADVGEVSETFQQAERLENASIDPDADARVPRLDPLESRARRERAFGHHSHGQPPTPTGVADVSTKLAQGAPNGRRGTMWCRQVTPS